MGGRGTVSNLSITREPEVIERTYEVITRASLVGQASYAFLDQLGRNWVVVTRDAEERADYHPDGTRFGTIGRDSAADVGDTVTVQFAISCS